jgi:hypothetical protein
MTQTTEDSYLFLVKCIKTCLNSECRNTLCTRFTVTNTNINSWADPAFETVCICVDGNLMNGCICVSFVALKGVCPCVSLDASLWKVASSHKPILILLPIPTGMK